LDWDPIVKVPPGIHTIPSARVGRADEVVFAPPLHTFTPNTIAMTPKARPHDNRPSGRRRATTAGGVGLVETVFLRRLMYEAFP
jgi:hypothetical protein